VNDEVPDHLGLPLGRFLELVASFGAEVAEISARLSRADQEGRIDAPRIL
jgi:hypothetical protein